MSTYRKAGRVLAIVLIVYATLVASHEGEFWPFSIYPMFSQAGKPWTRAIVREVEPNVPAGELWQRVSLSTLPGETFAVARHGIFQNDFANYVSKTRTWSPARARGLHTMFRDADVGERYLLIFKVEGALLDDKSDVRIDAVPVALFTPDSLQLNPALRPNPPSK
jgi:hypothetical protein